MPEPRTPISYVPLSGRVPELAELDRLCETASREPALLDPSLLGTVGQVGDQRFAVVEHMRSALEVAAAGQPVLVALDDLQWADPSTLRALGLLSRDLFSYPVAWLLARRPAPSSPSLFARATAMTPPVCWG